MSLPRRPQAVVFDMDGTLHDTEGVYVGALKLAMQALGVTLAEDFCHSLIGLPSKETQEVIQDRLGSDFPYADYQTLYRAHINRTLDVAIPLKAGAAELLDALARRGMKLAVATSATRQSAERQLDRSGLRRHLHALVTRDDVARGKPFPDPFLHAADLLGVAARDCLAVEDSINGVRAAFAAGMMPVMVPDLLVPTDEIRAMCVRVALDLAEVGVLLAEGG